MAQFKNRSILVVGGTGFIGTNLVKKLLKLGSKVTTLSLSVIWYMIGLAIFLLAELLYSS